MSTNNIILYENICCGYLLESPWRGGSNEYIRFYGEISKIIP